MNNEIKQIKVNGVVYDLVSATSQTKGISKLYNELGNNEDGSVTQKAINDAISEVGNRAHYTATPIFGSQTATTNATANIADPYLNIIENGVKSGGVLIKGTGATTVTAKDGIVTINSTATTNGSVKNVVRTSGNGAAGTTDTYTVYNTDDQPIGTFTVTNGTDGVNGADGAQGPKGETGALGPQGEAGPQGPKGDSFKYSDFTTEQLASLKGEKGETGTPGTNGTDGKGISAITNYYLVSPNSTGITRTGTSGWTTTVQTITTSDKYLWNYEKIDYTSGEPTYTDARIIGAYGDKGLDGIVDYTLLNGYVSKEDLNVEQLLERILTLESYHVLVSNPMISGQSVFSTNTAVTISAQDGATIYYTLDGSTPTNTSSVYTSTLTITDNTTVKALAKKGNSYSEIVSADFTKVHAPVINGTANFSDSLDITITADNGHTIRYTIDGTAPNSNSTVYTEPITITDTTVVYAIAIFDGVTSSISSRQFKKVPQAPQITGTDMFTDSSVITMTAENGCTIMYTTNGSTPAYGTNGSKYSSPITISDTTTIKAIAYNPTTKLSSVVAEATFTKSIPDSTNAYNLSTTAPTVSNLESVLNANAVKPDGAQELEVPTVTRPTLMYLTYPLDWEVVENGQLVKPVILDSNGYEQGAFYDEDTPTLTINGKVYRVLDVELGKDNYTIEF